MDEVTEPQLSEKKEPAKIEKTETSETKELDPSSQVPKELEPAISITEPEQTPLADEAKKEASEMAGTPRRGRKSAAPEPEKSGEEVGVRRSGRATRPSTKLSNADFVADPFDHDILISPAKQSDSKASTETSSPTKRGRPSKASQEAEKRVQSETSQPNDEIPVSPTKKQRGRPSKSSLVLKPVSDGESIQSPSKKQGRPSKQFQETATAVKTSPTKRSINVSPTKAKRNKPEVEGQLEVKGVTKIDSKTSPDEKQKAASKLSRNKRNVVPSTSATASASTLAAPPQKTEAESQRVASVPAVAKPETEEKKDDELDLNLDFDGPSRVAPVINTYSRKSKTYIEAEDDYILQEILDDGSPTRASRRSRYLELLDEEHEEFVDDKTDDLKRDTKTGDTADTPVATTSKHVCSKVVPEQPEEKMSAKVTAKKSVEQIGVTAPRKRFRLHNDQDFVGETITSMEQNEPQSNGRSRQDEKADSVVSETNLTAETGSGKKRTATKGKEEVTKTAAGRKGRGSAGETEAKPAGRRGRSAEAEIKATTAAGRRGGKTKKDEAAVVEKEILPATNKISSLPKEEASPFGRRGRGSSAASVKEGVSQSAPNSRGKRGRDQTAKEEPAPEEEVTAAVKPGGRKGRSSSAKEVSAPAKDNRRMVLPSKEETANTVEGTATVAPAKEALDSLEKSPQKRGMGQSTSNEPDKKKRRGRASASAASVTKLNDVESTDAKVKNGGKRKANANISILEDDEKLTHPNKKLKGSQVSKHKELSSGQEDLDISVSSTRGKRTPLAMEDVDNGGVNRRSRSTTKKVEALRRNSSVSSSGSPGRSPTGQVVVMLTGIESDEHQKIVKDLGHLGYQTTSNASECTVLLTDKIRRTAKFLCAMGRRIPIVSQRWLTASKKSKKFEDPWNYILSDKDSEDKFGFNLMTSLSSDKPLLAGYKVAATKKCIPKPQDLKDIVECAGGIWLKTLPKKPDDKLFVISCPEDEEQSAKLAKIGVAVVTNEFLLTGLLKQGLDPDAFAIKH